MTILKNIINKISIKKSIDNNDNDNSTGNSNNKKRIILLNQNQNNNNNEIINNDNSNNDKLFFKIFRSKVLNNQLFYHIRLYKENYNKSFTSRDKLLLEYEFRDYITVLKYDMFNYGHLDIGIIPHSITSLHLGFYNIDNNNNYSNKSLIEKGSLPNSITSLTIKGHYNSLFKVGVIPPSVKEFNLNDKYNQPLNNDEEQDNNNTNNNNNNNNKNNNILPNSLTSLSFGFAFNQPLNQYLTNLPLTYLNLGGHFNYPIQPNTLPKTLLHLQLSQSFNQELKISSLPPLLKIIIFGSHFNKALQPFVLPSANLTEVTFGTHFDEPINCPNIIPPSVTKLTILNSNYCHQLKKEFFPSVKKLITFKSKSKTNNLYLSSSSNVLSDFNELSNFY